VAGQARLALTPKHGYEGGLSSGSGALVEVQFTASRPVTVGMTTTLNLAAVHLYDPYGRDFANSALQNVVTTANGLLKLDNYATYLPIVLRMSSS
jgi:hypothetical protein